jgi:uncharacterized protein
MAIVAQLDTRPSLLVPPNLCGLPVKDGVMSQPFLREHSFPAMVSCLRSRQRKNQEKIMEKDRTSEGRSRGGENSGGNFKNDPQRAAEAGRKGGQESGGNFKNDPQRASEAGRKGGSASHQGGGKDR